MKIKNYVNYSSQLSNLASFTPCGSQTLSKMACRYPDVYPKTLIYGYKGHVICPQGKEYIDLIAALGAISVGYCDPTINDRIKTQLERGVLFSLPNTIEYEAARKLTELVPGTDMWKFGKNGTDGTLMAVRAARAFTGRTNILSLGYHGCNDIFESLGTRRAGMLDLTDSTKLFSGTFDYSDKSYACFIIEPDCGLDLNKVRDWCNATETLLIFDEVVTGGRYEGFTASSYFKVVPDLYVLGKGLANGLPLCAVGGTRRIMSTFERDDFFASGTFGGETLSLAAFLDTSKILVQELPKMIWNGSRIKEAFNKVFDGLATCKGYPTRLYFDFPTEAHKYLFWQEMSLQGVLVGYTNFIMARHTDKDITHIVNSIFESSKILKANWSDPLSELIGPIPTPAIRK